MKKFKKIASWLGIIIYLIVVLGFVNSKQNDTICSKLDIVITDSLTNRFVTNNDIRDLLKSSNLNILGYPIDQVNTKEIEDVLNNFKSIKNAEAYSTVDGTLHLLISQRQPILRILNSNNKGYYLDMEGKIIPLSEKCSSFVLIANGYIKEPYRIIENTSILDECTPESKKGERMLNLFNLAKYIYEHDFWNAQFEQIYIDKNGEVELIPRVGAHIIKLGPLDNYEEKLRKLLIFYENALPSAGWNEYEIINLKYKNQVVCTKR